MLFRSEITAKIDMNAADNKTKENVANIQAAVDKGRISVEKAKLLLDDLVE